MERHSQSWNISWKITVPITPFANWNILGTCPSPVGAAVSFRSRGEFRSLGWRGRIRWQGSGGSGGPGWFHEDELRSFLGLTDGKTSKHMMS